MSSTSVVMNLSPKKFSGAMVWSFVGHAVLWMAIGLILSWKPAAVVTEDYLDLGYQTFDEPPVAAPEEKKVAKMPEPVVPVDTKAIPDNSPKELQDEQGEVAGTQKAAVENIVGSDSNGNATATPYYKIKPKYPKAALVAGTEGWVLMQIDITESGEVENVRVVDGEQRNMFQSEARRAVAMWKYRPFLDSTGHPHKKQDHQVRVDFRLNEVMDPVTDN
ncbi:MAG: TonB family protein [Bdellovibrionia bacterium]